MRRILVQSLIISLCLFINMSVANGGSSTGYIDYDNYIHYYDGEGETVAVNGILYVLNADGTATAIGSPTSETGYNTVKSGSYYDPNTRMYYPDAILTTHYEATTFAFENLLDSCDGVFTFPEYVEKDGERYTVTTISMVRNINLPQGSYTSPTLTYSNIPYAWAYCYESNIEIVLPKTVTTIDDYAFYSDKIKKSEYITI